MISQIQMPDKVIMEEGSSPSQSRFILQPLEHGYANTLGNALRRVLLSSIPSAAIIGVKITDVLQEFQSIPHVIEDVSEIILNLKEIKIRIDNRKPQRIQFHVEGPGELTAKSIQDACPDIEVMDPHFHIATLSARANFDIELRIERGKGYIPAEEQIIKDFPVGMLPIDAVFTPILLVNYSVEPFRVGQKTDYEKLILDVRTDGTISAEEAVHTASQILNDHIKLFFNEMFKDKGDTDLMNTIIVPTTEPQVIEKERIKKILLTQLKDLELSVRSQNCLQLAGITTMADLVQKPESELLRLRNFGRKSLVELGELVKIYNLSFGMNVSQYLKDDSKAPRINL